MKYVKEKACIVNWSNHIQQIDCTCGMNQSVPTKPIRPINTHPTTATTNPTSTFILVIGASGDVAKKKIYPALFELYKEYIVSPSSPYKCGCNVQIHGYARSTLTPNEFRNQIRLPLLNDSIHHTRNSVEAFLSLCHYFHGRGYDDESAFIRVLSQFSLPKQQNVFLHVYLAVPPNIFPVVTSTIRNVMQKTKIIPLNSIRIVLEKPFGHDTASCRALLIALQQQQWQESNLFRIDHYLGKAAVRNILHLRRQLTRKSHLLAWNNRTIQSVHILSKETLSIEGRGGYYDAYGVVRDVIQNHLLQILTLVIMEIPEATEDVRDCKVDLLEQLATIQISDCVFGQYEGYAKDATIQDKKSKTPTYACIRLLANEHNSKWAGVPFYLEAGKALDVAICEVRISFKDNLFPKKLFKTLVIRIQPSPSVYMEVIDDHTGRRIESHRKIELGDSMLQDNSHSPLGAYAALILDVLHGKSANFVRADELLAAWRIFTPLLHEYERNSEIRPVIYAARSSGPVERFAFLQSKARSSL